MCPADQVFFVQDWLRQALPSAMLSPHLAAWSDSSGVACRLCMRIMHIRRRYVILRARAAPQSTARRSSARVRQDTGTASGMNLI